MYQGFAILSNYIPQNPGLGYHIKSCKRYCHEENQVNTLQSLNYIVCLNSICFEISRESCDESSEEIYMVFKPEHVRKCGVTDDFSLIPLGNS